MCTVRNVSSCPAFCFSSSTVTLPQTTRRPTTWTLCSSLKNHPAASRLKKQPSCPRCLPLPPSPDWIAPVWRWPTQTAPAASCLRCDQSGEAISCGARVLFNCISLSVQLLFASALLLGLLCLDLMSYM